MPKSKDTSKPRPHSFVVAKGTAVVPLKRAPVAKARVYPFDQMAIDDMLFFEGKTYASFGSYAHKQAKALGIKFDISTTVMRRNPTTGEWENCATDDPEAKRGVAVVRTS